MLLALQKIDGELIENICYFDPTAAYVEVRPETLYNCLHGKCMIINITVELPDGIDIRTLLDEVKGLYSPTSDFPPWAKGHL